MENSVKFSVVIPLFNKESYINKAIQSVLDQTYTKFECIVIDDGSTDNSIELVKQFNDQRLKLICKRNGGVSSARNVGIQNSNYDYVSFLDADDYWDPVYLEKIALLIKKYSNCGLYFSSHFIVKNDEELILKESLELANRGETCVFNLFDYFYKFKKYSWALHTSCCTVKKSVAIMCNGFDERISYYEDYEFFSKMALYSSFVYLNLPLTYYNCAVPLSNKLTGNVPSIRKHWLYYISNGPLGESDRISVKFFLNNFKFLLMTKYKNDPAAKKIYETIDFNYLFFKFKLIYILPDFFINSLFLVKNKCKLLGI